LKQLLAGGQREWLACRGRVRRSPGQSFFDSVNIETTGVASFTTVENFPRLINLSGLMLEDA
jgi:hypothetical protein